MSGGNPVHERIDWMLEQAAPRAGAAIAAIESAASLAGALHGSRRVFAVLETVEKQFQATADDVVALGRDTGTLDDPEVMAKLVAFGTKLKQLSRLEGAMAIKGMEKTVADGFGKLERYVDFAVRQTKAGLHKGKGDAAVTNNLNVTNSVVGGVQQGTSQSTQHVQQSVSFNDVRTALELFEKALAAAKLPASQEADLRADVQALRLQLDKSAPNVSVIQALGSGLKFAVEKLSQAMLTDAGHALWEALRI